VPPSGLVNTAHQLSMAVGLTVLVAVSTHAGTGLGGPAAVTARVSAALLGSSALLAVALLVALVVILPTCTSRRSPIAGSADVLQIEAMAPALVTR
jgi:hypothetical protein